MRLRHWRLPLTELWISTTIGPVPLSENSTFRPLARTIGMGPSSDMRRPAAGSVQRSTVTVRNVAGMMVRSGEVLVFWAVNRSSSSAWRSAALPLDSAAAKAFIVGP